MAGSLNREMNISGLVVVDRRPGVPQPHWLASQEIPLNEPPPAIHRQPSDELESVVHLENPLGHLFVMVLSLHKGQTGHLNTRSASTGSFEPCCFRVWWCQASGYCSAVRYVVKVLW